MRPFFIAFLLFANACAPTYRRSACDGGCATTREGTAADLVFATVDVALAVSHAASESPPPAVVQEQPSAVVTLHTEREFDREATRKALATVLYKDCGNGGDGALVVTFAADGTVRSVDVRGDYSANTRACLEGRFEGVRIPEFKGGAHAVLWRVHLPSVSTAPIPEAM